ncbi:hypothetical protein GCM10010389_06050 [Streptomyces echinoruber]|uniref:Uncharacterized protein n=1 Tax=Streptomyces echinoruber TaxID=68898 RepID=A0A918V500_9ACTN|nr:hypothetical protein GCM10010389_06050 [Streptomyces echinoruber]
MSPPRAPSRPGRFAGLRGAGAEGPGGAGVLSATGAGAPGPGMHRTRPGRPELDQDLGQDPGRDLLRI